MTIRDLPDLKEDFRAHTEEAIDDAESKHHWHTVYIPEGLCFVLCWEDGISLTLTSLETKVEMPQIAEHQQVENDRG